MVSTDDSPEIRRAASGAAAEAVAWSSAHEADFVRRLAELVAVDSGPDAPEGRDEVAAMLAGWAAACGCQTEIVAHPAGGHLICRLPGNGVGRIVLLGHHDTVFSAGAAAARPMTLTDGRAYGPGVADMKGGLLLALTAMEALANGAAAVRGGGVAQRPGRRGEGRPLRDAGPRPRGRRRARPRVRPRERGLRRRPQDRRVAAAGSRGQSAHMRAQSPAWGGAR